MKVNAVGRLPKNPFYVAVLRRKLSEDVTVTILVSSVKVLIRKHEFSSYLCFSDSSDQHLLATKLDKACSFCNNYRNSENPSESCM